MSAINSIMNDLNEVFKEVDEKVLASTLRWAFKARERIKEYKASDEYKGSRKSRDSVWIRHEKIKSIAGGKAWIEPLSWWKEDSLKSFVEENHKKVIEKRNIKILKKLVDAGVSKVLDSKFAYSNDGFNGEFSVVTDSGNKLVTINTIYAGGYNIQCLHLRVLVKVEE